MRATLRQWRGQYDLVLFTDSFDSFIFAPADEIVAKFLSFEVPMVVSGEVNLWPNPHLESALPRVPPDSRYRYPNSGGCVSPTTTK